MPHVTIKILEGRSEPVKALCVAKVAQAIREATGTPDKYISVAVEEFTPEQWQEVFHNEIENNPNIIKSPNYKPQDLL